MVLGPLKATSGGAINLNCHLMVSFSSERAYSVKPIIQNLRHFSTAWRQPALKYS